MPARDLEAQLADLATTLDAPSGDGVAAAAVARLRSEGAGVPGAASARALPLRPSSGRRLGIAVAAIAAAITAVAAAPAVADWLGVRGVEIRREQQQAGPASSTSTTPVAPLGTPLDLGVPVASLDAAEEAAGFAPIVPDALGTPDAVWVDRRGEAPFISLVYDGGPLVTEFDATITADAVLSKMARPDTVIERLRIHGEPAVWIEGVHEVAVLGRDGEHVFERLRLSDRVLLVQHGPLTVRIEAAAGMSRDEAVRIADSLPR